MNANRAARRREEKGIPEEGVTGRLGCKFCKSTQGTYVKFGNRFECRTKDCKGNPRTIADMRLGGTTDE